ncbi:hypothetical protein [Saccharothrix sp. Mg75]|uniref:hypothetical protein n=1 Tax=Saccharothrix sp. Mg75 TaxID=3445357 RepID=UPI003EE9EB98
MGVVHGRAEPIRLAILDNDPIVRHSLHNWLCDADPEVSVAVVVGTWSDGHRECGPS